MYKINPSISNMYCLRCGRTYQVDDYYIGCPVCAKEAHSANLSFTYRGEQKIRVGNKRMYRYIDFLPYQSFPTLGEGNTPIVSFPRIAKRFSLESIWFKNEFQNPTGSHKDRMSPLTVARAMHQNKKGVVAASSGNAGVSLATYAAAVGIDCSIISTKNINPVWKKAIELTGANLILTETSADRWLLMRKMVEDENWYPVTNFVDPPVGSNPFGIQGYKTISYEIYEEFGRNIPSFIIAPSARADLIWGIYEGFQDLLRLQLIDNIPRLVAVEPFPRISRVFDGEDYRNSFPGDSSATASIGGNSVTFQAIDALRKTNGMAVNICQSQVPGYQRDLAQDGVYLESSSATVISALTQLIDKKVIKPSDTVLIIATSTGYKDYPL